MTGSFILDYYLLVFLASCGIFQIIGAWKALLGMLYIKHRTGSFFLGLVNIICSFTWFFLSEPRNVSDSAQGMNGNEQFAYFFAGSGTALAFTLLVSSLINRKLIIDRPNLLLGLDALKQTSYIHALCWTWRCSLQKLALDDSSMVLPSWMLGRTRATAIARFVRQAWHLGAFR